MIIEETLRESFMKSFFAILLLTFSLALNAETFQSNLGEISYFDQGNKNLPVMLLVHGLPSSKEIFKPLEAWDSIISLIDFSDSGIKLTKATKTLMTFSSSFNFLNMNI